MIAVWQLILGYLVGCIISFLLCNGYFKFIINKFDYDFELNCIAQIYKRLVTLCSFIGALVVINDWIKVNIMYKDGDIVSLYVDGQLVLQFVYKSNDSIDDPYEFDTYIYHDIAGNIKSGIVYIETYGSRYSKTYYNTTLNTATSVESFNADLNNTGLYWDSKNKAVKSSSSNAIVYFNGTSWEEGSKVTSWVSNKGIKYVFNKILSFIKCKSNILKITLVTLLGIAALVFLIVEMSLNLNNNKYISTGVVQGTVIYSTDKEIEIFTADRETHVLKIDHANYNFVVGHLVQIKFRHCDYNDNVIYVKLVK